MMKNASKEILEWYCDKGVDGELPQTWSEFWSAVIEFFTGQTLENIKRYKNEPWTEFFIRLAEWTENRKISNIDVFK